MFRKIRGSIVFIGVCVLIGLGFGWIMVDKLPEDLSGFQLIISNVLGILILLLTIFMQIILHELGHMFAGLIRGWKFLSFMIVSFMISNKNGKLHFSRLKIAGAGGQCLMMPPEKGDSDFGIAFYNAGGILMNWLTALVAILVMMLCWRSLSYLESVLLFGLSLSGFIFGLINAIPRITSDLANDGENILSLKKDPFSTKVFMQSLRVLGEMHQGKTIEEVMPDYICENQEIDYSNSIHVMAQNFDLTLAIYRLDFEKAHQISDLFDLNKKLIIKLYQQEIGMEEIYLNLVDPIPGLSVKRYLSKEMELYLTQQVAASRPTALRVKYVLAHLLEHNEEKAEMYYQRFMKACDRYHVIGEVKYERKLVDYARNLQ